MTLMQSNGIWHLPAWVFIIVWVIVMVYVALKFRRQRDLAKQQPRVRSVDVQAQFQKQASFVASAQLVLFGLAAASSVVAYFAFSRSDALFIAAAMCILVCVSLLFASVAGVRCPVCTTAVRGNNRFCMKCGAQLLP
jgi:hypothetical protein